MLAETYPIQVLLMTLSGLVNRHQADVIGYLVEENRVLKEQMKGRKLRLNDDQRRRLAAKAKALGRKTLDKVATIVTPDTLMREALILSGRKITKKRNITRNTVDVVNNEEVLMKEDYSIPSPEIENYMRERSKNSPLTKCT